ncbi:MAG: hypothetical protein ACK4NF_04385, partial [Planctomycetota bacterium]
MKHISQDKLAGAIYGYVLAKLFSNQYAGGKTKYSRILKFEPKFNNLSEIEELLELFNFFSHSKSLNWMQTFNIFISKYSLTPISGLIADVLNPVESFKGIVPVISVYTILNGDKDLKQVFCEINSLVSLKRFSDEVTCASFALFYILNK